MTNAVVAPAVSAPIPTLQEALTVLLGFVSNHADKGNVAAQGMVKFANAALAADANSAARPVIVVIEMDGGLVNVVEASHAVDVYILDADTEGGDEANIAEIDGNDFYVGGHGVTAEEAKGLNDAKFNETVAQIDAHFNVVEANLEWVWPDEDSNSTAVTVDKRTGVVTILNRDELDADYDDGSVRQRIMFDDGDDVFEVEPIGEGEWRILPHLLADFVVAADAIEQAD